MENNIIWTDGIDLVLNDIKTKALNNSEYHKKNYYFFKGYLKYFRIPTIILSGVNSVFNVGLQPFVPQGIISVLCCSISLICGIIASVELFLGIQNVMEKELIASKEFYILSSDIFKTLSIERKYRNIDGKVYLDNVHTKYCNLIEQSNLLNTTLENFQVANFLGNYINNFNEENNNKKTIEKYDLILNDKSINYDENKDINMDINELTEKKEEKELITIQINKDDIN